VIGDGGQDVLDGGPGNDDVLGEGGAIRCREESATTSCTAAPARTF
jgi:hypothetical protein